MNTEIVCKLRLAFAVGGIAFGAGLMTMAAMGIYYETRADRTNRYHRQEIVSIQDTHKTERKSQDSRHTRANNETKRDITQRLDNIERLLSGGK